MHSSVKQDFTVKGSSHAFICQRSLAQPDVCPNFPNQDCCDFTLVATVDVSAGGNGS
ncbi:hypothetical protein SAMN02745121_07336 [Nannocystis exedens]|uniref:Uncharacterized protein n=1 Tax=Nannocystis exedens TaxID=54 RepID=A0A1I2GJU6_9BACT|nr:hypothetical protein [Nannocystis exedens]PCC73588.1 hypothetical protein NAEX_06676 [Nannocystis exedens]SFF17518.1 hypothetical protein SAMN02745121_07336 [Nannocystis exedens]